MQVDKLTVEAPTGDAMKWSTCVDMMFLSFSYACCEVFEIPHISFRQSKDCMASVSQSFCSPRRSASEKHSPHFSLYLSCEARKNNLKKTIRECQRRSLLYRERSEIGSLINCYRRHRTRHFFVREKQRSSAAEGRPRNEQQATHRQPLLPGVVPSWRWK